MIYRNLTRWGLALAVAGTASAALGACATAEDEGPYAGLPDRGVTEEGTPYTCRRIQVTGTRFYERICASDEEWAEQARRTQDGTDEIGNADRSPVRPFEGPGTR